MAFGFLKKVFNKKVWLTVLNVSMIVADIMPFAELGVNAIGMATGKDVHKIADVIRLLNAKPDELSFDPNKKYTNSEMQGILMGAARLAVRGEIKKAIQQTGNAGLLIGGQKIKDESEVPDAVINAAVNSAYLILKEKVDKIN
jgi:hypothetical protein